MCLYNNCLLLVKLPEGDFSCNIKEWNIQCLLGPKLVQWKKITGTEKPFQVFAPGSYSKYLHFLNKALCHKTDR